MDVLETGPTAFVRTAIVQKLIKAGCRVTGLALRKSRKSTY